MLFNSYEFLFDFLPLAFLLFWYGGTGIRWRLAVLTFGSYTFYSWWQFSGWREFVLSLSITDWKSLGAALWKWRFTLIMLFSSSVDYWAAKWIVGLPPAARGPRKLLLALSLAVNLGLLAFFKYFGFFTQIANDVSRFLGGGDVPIVSMILPVGISFYTFESISYVIDIYRGVARPARSYLDYACFISFFPHLVAGPIIRYSDILHQFRDVAWARPRPDWHHVSVGLVFFSVGMGKKLLIADPIAQAVNPLWTQFSTGESLGLTGSWAAVLGYTFRIYFDFSGYSDMAIGLGHLFAVKLPQNFNSPYQATDPSDFWRRWHMTLSSWLRDYLYIPLGGNRRGNQSRNLLITMLLGGLWHGAAWLFVVWGAWHGLLLVGFHWLKQRNWVLSNESLATRWVNRMLTFLLVVIGWVFFRTADVNVESYGFASVLPAFRMFADMLGLNGLTPATLAGQIGPLFWCGIAACWAWCNFLPNSQEVGYRSEPTVMHGLLAGTLLAVTVLQLGSGVDFLYFRF
ncbi:MAG TPA: MBOAT family O-acyltransferase [Planctomycetaceae bacterium]|nr:MBOAT family O-acyltransferase [Planctomycetaceae bacterium]